MVDLNNKLKEEIALLQTNIQQLKTKTFQRLTVTDEIGKSVDAFISKTEKSISYCKKRRSKIGIAEAPTQNGSNLRKPKKNTKQPRGPPSSLNNKPPQVQEPKTTRSDVAKSQHIQSKQPVVSVGTIKTKPVVVEEEEPLLKPPFENLANTPEEPSVANDEATQPKKQPVTSLEEIKSTKPAVEVENLPQEPPSDKANTQEEEPPPKKTMSTSANDDVSITSRRLLLPILLEMVIPPDLDILDRPLVALTMAVLTNTDVDLTLKGCSRRCNEGSHPHPQAMLLVPNNENDDDDDGILPIVGDLAMARYLVRRQGQQPNPQQQALQDMWIDYAQSLKPLPRDQTQKAIGMTLGHALVSRTYLVGESLTMADVALFGALGLPCQAHDLFLISKAFEKEYPAALRWTNMMAVHPAIRQATQLAMGVNGTTNYFGSSLASPPLDPSGKRLLLEGAIPGSVVTRKRFLPEPNGYLHLGHVKSVLLNDYYARQYKGRFIIRFDDTNPATKSSKEEKEQEEYQESIVVEDLKLLGVEPDMYTYTSDYFPVIYGYALQLIENGHAYMDNTAMEQMKQEQKQRVPSKYRNQQTPAEAKDKFLLMCSCKEDGAPWCLRAKMDMNSDMRTMRDPVLFRQNLEPHRRTGTTYKAYPTYALACPIVDSLEGVTHALFTTTFHDQESPYQWIQSTLGLRRSRIHEIPRVNFMNTVLAKSNLKWFIDQGLVEGWGDARFPTVRGLVRRGVHAGALKKFMYNQDASRRVVNMDWSRFWEANKKEIDKQAKRFMAIDADDHVPLKVTSGPAMDANVYLTIPCHFREPSLGSRALRIGQDVILESADVDGIAEGEEIVLIRWGLVKITKVIMFEGKQKVGSLEGVFIPNGDCKMAKRKLSWVVKTENNPMVTLTEFDRLITKCKLEDGDSLEECANRNTIAVAHAVGDAGLKTVQEHEIIQLERRGYFRVDSPYRDGKSMVLYMIPGRRSKAMSGLGGNFSLN